MPYTIQIAGIALPANEEQAAHAVAGNLAQINHCCESFSAAVALFQTSREMVRTSEDHPERRKLASSWQFLAGEGGAISLYNFWMLTQAINEKLLYRCPTIHQWIDDEAKKRAQQIFTATFPNVAGVRHSVAHAGELGATPEKRAGHSARGNIAGTFITQGENDSVFFSGALVNETFMATFEGKAIGYDINQASADALRQATDAWCHAFARVEEETFNLWEKQKAEGTARQPGG